MNDHPTIAASNINAASSDAELDWLEKVYVRDQRQLTLRAILFGMAIGAVMCLSNLYVFFKAGWSMGVTITASILAFALFRGLVATGLARTPLTALENNALTTVASGAGYMTAGGNMAAYGALLMATAVRPDPLALVAWFATISALGVFAAIPIKRQLINKEALVFPTGTATAETIRSLHAAGAAGAAGLQAAEGALKAKMLALGAAFAAMLTFLRDVKLPWPGLNVPAAFGLPFEIAGRAARDWTLALKSDAVLFGAGALMSFRTGWSLLLGSSVTYIFLAPALLERGIISGVGYKNIVDWTVWPGAALLVAAGLTSFALDWRSVVRSLAGMSRIVGGKTAASVHPIEAVECPGWWFPAGFAALAPIVIALMVWLFAIPIWAALVALPLAMVMGFVAARVTGDTDVTPTKALGPVTQLIYGVLTPGNLPGNIMSANVTGGIGLHAADLLTTLKTGWLLGASPRAQCRAQLFGVAAGAVFVVPAFFILIRDPAVLGTDEWPAPACMVWEGVSRAFADGLSALGGAARTGIAAGALLGVALSLLERFAPRRLRPLVPSPSGLGIAMVVPGSNAISMFLGASMAELLRRLSPKLADRLVVPVSSGLIAGESLMGVVVAIL